MNRKRTVAIAAVALLVLASLGTYIAVYEMRMFEKPDPEDTERFSDKDPISSNFYAEANNNSSEILLQNKDLAREVFTRVAENRHEKQLSEPAFPPSMNSVARAHSYEMWMNDTVQTENPAARYEGMDPSTYCSEYRSIAYTTTIAPESFDENGTPEFPPKFALASSLVNQTLSQPDGEDILYWDEEKLVMGVGIHLVSVGEGENREATAYVTIDACRED